MVTMDQETTVAVESTDTQAEEKVQAQETQEKFYSQQEFDDAMAKMRHAVTQKVLKPYQELGDIEELREIKTTQERAKHEEAMKKGEFEQILQDMATKKDAEIQKRDAVIKEYKVDSPLLNAAAKYRSVNPEQVKALLKNNVRLGEEGEVEVLDSNGQIRYTDSGQALSVDDMVKEFLDSNPHFVQPTPSTSNSKSSVFNEREEMDISKLDMSNPEHRKKYAEYRQTKINGDF
jgi:hypothetical protein